MGMFGKPKSQGAQELDDAIRTANARAGTAFQDGDESGYADASADLAALRDMRLAMNETDA